jgi:starch synthase (maltosyl-transferring)
VNLKVKEKRLTDTKGSAVFDSGPLIYILSASTAGEADNRAKHFSRIASCGFDWVCYVPKAGKLHPNTFAALAGEAHRAGLQMMIQAPRAEVADYKEWAAAGILGFIVSPSAEHASEWRAALDRLHAETTKPLFIADTLGRPWEEVLTLAGAGFDYVINSSAWWDLRERWFLHQQQELSRLVSTLSSPEPLHGMRLVHRLTSLSPAHQEAIYRGRYLVAAISASGLICPMGYEFASGVMFDSATARESDWDLAQSETPFDLSDDIRRVNKLKATMPVLQGEGNLRLASAPGRMPAAIVRRSECAPGEVACLLVNSSPYEQHSPPLLELAIAAGTARFVELGKKKPAVLKNLAPYESRLLFTAPQSQSRPLSLKESNKRLEALAANRVVIERVTPELDGGRFPVKRVAGDTFRVEADIFSDGHDVIDAAILYRAPDAEVWSEVPMTFVDNDRWAGNFTLTEIGRWTYTIVAWRDLFATWRQEVAKKHGAGQSITLELTEGCELVKRAAKAAEGRVGDELKGLAHDLANIDDEGTLLGLLESDEMADVMRRAGLRTNLSRHERDLEVTVDRPIAACAAWYELMPRSQSGDPLRHGTFDDVIARLPYVRDLGFDVLYFPPIHPIGETNRKGRNNSLSARPDDPGSPYAIGAEEGGHDAIHRELGGFEDFARLIKAARAHGIEIAIDFAIQCSPDHPWIKEHPQWFDWRPDGSIKFAENPPKKYEDIVNVHFYRDALPSLWIALRDIVRFWIEKGVTIFRVDNPHTKPVPFWEWLISDIQKEHPEAVFLAEAFTRPKMMKRLAKVGFTQSYSYFTWRNTKGELVDYLTELTKTEAAEYMRPNFFVNTPDINPVFLQTSGPAGFKARLILAATLDPLYGIYNGFELCEATPMPGKEEYLNSEKYEIKSWDWNRPGNIKDDVRLVNAIRRNNPALWHFTNLTFLNAWNDDIIAFYKVSAGRDNLVIVAINLDPHNPQGADFEVPLWEFSLPDNASIEAVDLVEDKRFTWNGKVQYVWLDPAHRPYAIWRLVPPCTV